MPRAPRPSMPSTTRRPIGVPPLWSGWTRASPGTSRIPRRVRLLDRRVVVGRRTVLVAVKRRWSASRSRRRARRSSQRRPVCSAQAARSSSGAPTATNCVSRPARSATTRPAFRSRPRCLATAWRLIGSPSDNAVAVTGPRSATARRIDRRVGSASAANTASLGSRAMTGSAGISGRAPRPPRTAARGRAGDSSSGRPLGGWPAPDGTIARRHATEADASVSVTTTRVPPMVGASTISTLEARGSSSGRHQVHTRRRPSSTSSSRS